MKNKKYDFSGYATKNDLKCSDGRIIRKDAFKEADGTTVPLVWQHFHNTPENILGHALLENKEDGVYAYATFNDTPTGKHAKSLVEHGDITALSIFANQLVEKGKDVLHGALREVSLVLAGANPGAMIDNVQIEHGDGSLSTAATEAVIYTGEILATTEIEHSSKDDDKTIEEVFKTLNEEQKTAVYAIIAHAIEGQDDDESDDEEENIEHSDGGEKMKKNAFDKTEETKVGGVLTHDQFQTIMADAQKLGSLKDAILAHAVDYGIDNIDVLFPNAQALSKDPDWLKREDDWVQGVLAAVHKSPFSRIKSVIMDMDIDAARAKGYIKATEKVEVYLSAAKRETTPCTIYVKQKLDRDDIIDVVDFDIVAMIRFELRTLLDEELAQAILIGDGRTMADPYKIKEDKLRPIWNDVDLYTVKEKLVQKVDYKAMIKEISLTHKRFKGTSGPTFFTTPDIHTNMLWVEDDNGRRIYESDATLCAALRVKNIVEIPQFEGKTRTLADNSERELLAIKVNLRDYNVGADKGGQVASFDDFDIDFNQFKYLMETRVSGALTKPHSAQVFEFETVAPNAG